ncbi:unnamed protein product [Protopolystoma xenopodis]|uniref:Uncharacterized protein n=1 Tax=Protopolystoma xenopodis TaxID=117903 RepID=A0A448W9Z8_9PLAT|nr:unnamed protein product [Protopolystoma xenopodis]
MKSPVRQPQRHTDESEHADEASVERPTRFPCVKLRLHPLSIRLSCLSSTSFHFRGPSLQRQTSGTPDHLKTRSSEPRTSRWERVKMQRSICPRRALLEAVLPGRLNPFEDRDTTGHNTTTIRSTQSQSSLLESNASSDVPTRCNNQDSAQTLRYRLS